jgi:plastocyanin
VTRRPAAIALVLVLLLTLGAGEAAAGPVDAPESEPHVDVREEYFYPSLVAVRRGGTVVWDFTGQATHDVVDDTGLELFDSGLTPPGGPSFAFTFAAAGTYRYVCTLHAGMTGRVQVPVRAVADGDGITVVWSSGPLPEGLVGDVQVRRAGHRWRAWLEGTTEARGTYPATRGTFRFRAHLRSTDDAARSGWSPAERIEFGRAA